MPLHVRELGPTHLVSIIQPELQPERPPAIPSQRHLRVAVHDVSEDDGWSVLVQPPDVRQVIEFFDAWEPDAGSLLVHCYAGVSRSTAVALIAHTMKSGDPQASARSLREAASWAVPNRRIVALADDELGLGGALLRARETMGSATLLATRPSLAILEV